MAEQLSEQPVGSEFGLEPLRPDLYISKRPSPDSRVIVSDQDYRKGTEFGGVGGLIQPPPHVPDAAERRMMIMAVDPTDTGLEEGSVLYPELEGNF